MTQRCRFALEDLLRLVEIDLAIGEHDEPATAWREQVRDEAAMLLAVEEVTP